MCIFSGVQQWYVLLIGRRVGPPVWLCVDTTAADTPNAEVDGARALLEEQIRALSADLDKLVLERDASMAEIQQLKGRSNRVLKAYHELCFQGHLGVGLHGTMSLLAFPDNGCSARW